jgi:hypothetical protein
MVFKQGAGNVKAVFSQYSSNNVYRQNSGGSGSLSSITEHVFHGSIQAVLICNSGNIQAVY